MTMLRRIGILIVALLALVCAAPQAWTQTKVGPEFHVNTYAPNNQTGASAVRLKNGGFVVTWGSVGQDGSNYGVYGQRYSATGARHGKEFRVNTYTAGAEYGPSTAGLGDGGFVVTWMSADGQDGSSYGVYGQRYGATGARVGGEFKVNTYTVGAQVNQSVAGLSNGGFVVTWCSVDQDGSSGGIYGQIYSAAGQRVGTEFRVNTYTANAQNSPAVRLNGSGFVVVWTSDGQDGSASGIYGQRFNAAGGRLGNEFRVNSYTANGQFDPSIVTLSRGGGFVVTWTSKGPGNYSDVFAQRFSATGARVGSQFRVNSNITNYQISPSIAGLNDGGFVVAWSGPDGSGSGVYAQRYNAAGVRVGGEFGVNTRKANDQGEPSVAGLGNGGFVITWTSQWQEGIAGSGTGIFGQRFGS